MILLIGDPRDPHVSGVAEIVARLGKRVAIFSRFNRRCTIAMGYRGGTWQVRFAVGDSCFDGGEIEAIWWRQKPFRYYRSPALEKSEAESFADREWYQQLQALPAFLSLPAAGWINHPDVQLRANLKPIQLRWAHSAGLALPETWFGNMPPAVDTLAAAGKTVYKTFSGHVFDGGRFIFTTLLGKKPIGAKTRDRIAMAPGIYQAYVEKRHELRIYFVDRTLFAIKVDSQRRRKTRVDWRHDQSVNLYEPIELDRDLHARLLDFVKLSGLRFGAIDGIVARDGEFYFLECNPAGQWLWIEEFTGMPIRRAVAEALCRGPASPRADRTADGQAVLQRPVAAA